MKRKQPTAKELIKDFFTIIWICIILLVPFMFFLHYDIYSAVLLMIIYYSGFNYLVKFKDEKSIERLTS